MNATPTLATEDDIRLEGTQTRRGQALKPLGSGTGLLDTSRSEQPEQSFPPQLRRLENVPLSCHLKLLPGEASAVITFVGLDMTGILHWATGFLWNGYGLNVVKSFGAQLGRGQGTDLLVCGARDKLEALDRDLKRWSEQVTLSGYKFKPAMYYRLRFTAPATPGLTYRLTECLNQLNLNIEEFSTMNAETPGGVYALLDMRLETPETVTPEMMDQLREDLLALDPAAQADLYPEP